MNYDSVYKSYEFKLSQTNDRTPIESLTNEANYRRVESYFMINNTWGAGTIKEPAAPK